MTNTIQEIQNAENSAFEIIKEAKRKALGAILNAKENMEKEISELKNSLKEERMQKITSQKDTLAELYKKIIKKGAEKTVVITENNRKKAVEFILDNI